MVYKKCYDQILIQHTVPSSSHQDPKTSGLKGGPIPEITKFEHIFVAVITFFPFFCANTFYTSLLLIVCALR